MNWLVLHILKWDNILFGDSCRTFSANVKCLTTVIIAFMNQLTLLYWCTDSVIKISHIALNLHARFQRLLSMYAYDITHRVFDIFSIYAHHDLHPQKRICVWSHQSAYIRISEAFCPDTDDLRISFAKIGK